jgi:hypothetical protein
MAAAGLWRATPWRGGPWPPTKHALNLPSDNMKEHGRRLGVAY